MNEQSGMKQASTVSPEQGEIGIEWLPFENLHISNLNGRTMIDEDGIERLAENIREVGLIHNLAGLREGDGRVGIVAGGRRLRALALLQDQERFRVVPVRVTDDIDVAKVWAASENNVREALHPADEIREYGRMASDGLPVPAIAVAFGKSEAHVYRRLKLAGLPEPVLDALCADEITLGMAACFTLCNDDALALKVLEQVRGGAMSEHHLKRMLKPDCVKSTDRRARFVGEAAYTEAGGRLTRDLFADEVLYDDAGLLDEVFGQMLEEAAEEVRASEGWKWVEACPETYVGWHQIEAMKAARVYPEAGTLSEDQSQRYDELAELAEAGELDDAAEAELEALQRILDGTYSEVQKVLSGAIVHVDREGALTVCGGLVAKEDRDAAIAAGILGPSAHDTASDRPQPAIPAKLQHDLDCIFRGARQNALLGHPDLLLDLLAFQLAGRMGYRSAFGQRTDDVPNMPEQSDGYALDKRLIEPGFCPKDPVGSDLARGFRAFRNQGRKATRAELTRQLSALLSIEDEKLGQLVDKEAGTSIRSVWTPTAAGFFKRVRGDYLDDLFRELLGLKPNHPSATTFARLKKMEKAERLEKLFADPEYRTTAGLSEAQIAKIDAWLPEGMG
ncbi:ParB/RepB/Spo0J family partition protein [Roseovarius nitratireducens]|uniref:ParB/RepB/Spo0J family partition protein n=1 Tax=Roseovarius nitratireducens TaxID=2044597 RepID=UPI000CE262D3|nr:ParB/RepB/Spo0J family partition protein [Roseovarius nitratireducens]